MVQCSSMHRRQPAEGVQDGPPTRRPLVRTPNKKLRSRTIGADNRRMAMGLTPNCRAAGLGCAVRQIVRPARN